jgi:hypothetical protein
LVEPGTKFEHAIKWQIPVLKPEWVFESSEKGSCLRLTNFLWPAPNIDSNGSKGICLYDLVFRD